MAVNINKQKKNKVTNAVTMDNAKKTGIASLAGSNAVKPYSDANTANAANAAKQYAAALKASAPFINPVLHNTSMISSAPAVAQNVAANNNTNITNSVGEYADVLKEMQSLHNKERLGLKNKYTASALNKLSAENAKSADIKNYAFSPRDPYEGLDPAHRRLARTTNAKIASRNGASLSRINAGREEQAAIDAEMRQYEVEAAIKLNKAYDSRFPQLETQKLFDDAAGNISYAMLPGTEINGKPNSAWQLQARMYRDYGTALYTREGADARIKELEDEKATLERELKLGGEKYLTSGVSMQGQQYGTIESYNYTEAGKELQRRIDEIDGQIAAMNRQRNLIDPDMFTAETISNDEEYAKWLKGKEIADFVAPNSATHGTDKAWLTGIYQQGDREEYLEGLRGAYNDALGITDMPFVTPEERQRMLFQAETAYNSAQAPQSAREQASYNVYTGPDSLMAQIEKNNINASNAVFKSGKLTDDDLEMLSQAYTFFSTGHGTGYTIPFEAGFTSDDQKSVFMYLMETGKYDKAYEYLTETTRFAREQEKARIDYESNKEFAEENPEAAFFLAAGANVIGSTLYGIPNLIRAVKDNMSGSTTPFGDEYFFNSAEGALLAGITEDMTPAERFGVNTAFNVVTNFSRNALTGATMGFSTGSAFATGISAFTQKLAENNQNGVDGIKAIASAGAAGIMENVSEKVSLDIILDGSGTALQNFLNSVLSEPAQEVFNDIAVEITDQMILGLDSDFNITVQELVASGMPYEQARGEAAKQVLEGLLETALSSMISGAVTGAGESIAFAKREGGWTQKSEEALTKKFSNAANDVNSTKERVSDTAKNLNQQREALADTQAELDYINQLEQQEQEREQSEVKAEKSEEAETEAVEAEADTEAKQEVKETETPATETKTESSESNTEETKTESKKEYKYASKEERDARKAELEKLKDKQTAKLEQTKGVMLKQSQKLDKSIREAKDAYKKLKDKQNGVRVKTDSDTTEGISEKQDTPVKNAEVRKGVTVQGMNKDGQLTLSNGDKISVYHNDLDFTPVTRSLAENSVNLAQEYNISPAVVYESYTEGTDVKTFSDSVESLLNAGYTGASFDAVYKSTEGMDATMARHVYDAAAASSQADVDKRTAAYQRVRANNTRAGSSFVRITDDAQAELVKDGANSKRLGVVEAMKNLVEMSPDSGIKIEFFASKADANGNYPSTQGEYNASTGVISVDINAGRNNVRDLADYTVGQVVSHEMTHMLAANNVQGYESLKSFISESLAKQGLNMTKEARDIQAQYRKSGVDLSIDKAIEEVVARSCEQVLKDSKIAERIAKQDRTLAEKIRDFIADFAAKLKKAFSGSRNNALSIAMKDYMDGLVKVWDDALEGAIGNIKSTQMDTMTNAKNLGVSAETARGITEAGVVLTKDGNIVAPDIARQMEEAGYEKPQDNSMYSERNVDEWAETLMSMEHLNEEQAMKGAKLVKDFANHILSDAVLRLGMAHGKVYGKKDKSKGLGALRANVEYTFTLDFDTKCPRTINFGMYRDAIQRQIGRKLNEVEARNLIELLRAYKQMIPCTYCYVENKRMLASEQYNKYIGYRNAVMDGIVKGENARSKMYGYKKGALTAASEKRYGEFKSYVDNGGKHTHIELTEMQEMVERSQAAILNYLDSEYDKPENYVQDEKTRRVGKNGEDLVFTDFTLPKGVTESGLLNQVMEHFGISEEEKGCRAQAAIAVATWLYDMQMGQGHDINPKYNDSSEFFNEYMAVHDEAMKYASSSSSAHGVDNYVMYNSEVWDIDVDTKKNINAQGGIRKHSSNDFRIDYLVDYMQAFVDLASDTRGGFGWKGHTYTKSTEYAEIFAPTNDIINMSIAFKTIRHADGSYEIVPNIEEGAQQEDVKRLRLMYENVGSMAMVVDNEQLSYAINSDWVDMIIPFHASGMKKALYNNVMAWVDFTSRQHEKKPSSTYMRERLGEIGIKLPKGTKTDGVLAEYTKHFNPLNTVFKNAKGEDVDLGHVPYFLPGDRTDPKTGAIIPGHHNDVNRYRELCEKYGVQPRFYGVKVDDGDGKGKMIDITKHKNYLKVLKETSKIPEGGQKAIVANFNMDYAMKLMNSEGMKNMIYPKLDQSVIDTYLGYYVDENGKSKGRKLGDLPFEAMRTKQLLENKDSDVLRQMEDAIESAAEKGMTKKMLDSLGTVTAEERKQIERGILPEKYRDVAGDTMKSLREHSLTEREYSDAESTVAEEADAMTEEQREASSSYESVMHSLRVDDEATIDEIWKDGYITTYKAMQIIDGKLYAPMAAKVNGKLTGDYEFGKTYQSVENTSIIKWDKNAKGEDVAYFDLDKGNGKKIRARYNPYEHSSNYVLNDQFSEAYKRPNLVVVECRVPKSQANGAYTAEYAKDSTGWKEWKSGTVAGEIAKQKNGFRRNVFLSRYITPVRILSDAEVAQKYKEYLSGTNGISVPYNVVTPSLRKELEKIGVPMISEAGKSGADSDTMKSIRERDTEYMDAVNSGDMRKAQRMVVETAKENGYRPLRLYHGTQNYGFTKFDLSKMDDGKSIFVTESLENAKTYSGEVFSKDIGTPGTGKWSAEEVNNMSTEDLILNSEYDSGEHGYHAMSENEVSEMRESAWKTLKKASDFINDVLEYSKDKKEIAAMSRLGRAIERDNLEKILKSATVESITTYGQTLGTIEMLRSSFRYANDNYESWEFNVTPIIEALHNLFITQDGTGFAFKGGTNKEIVRREQLIDSVLNRKEGARPGVYTLYGKDSNLLTIEGGHTAWNFIDGSLIGSKRAYVTTREVSEYAKKNGYSGVKFFDLNDDGGYGLSGYNTIYIYFNPSDLKSNAPVTYDDNGNVIPLSERFNTENEDIRYSIRDTEGNSLTKKQQEFFKDSKIRDEDGNLMNVYHATDNDFTVFDKDRLGEMTDGNTSDKITQATSRLGFWFNSKNDIAKRTYQDKTMSVYLNIKNPYYVNSLDALYDEIYTSAAEDGIDIDEADPSEIVESFLASIGNHDGIVLKDTEFGGVSYVAFEPNQIKEVANQSPTNSPDIRYSMRDKETVSDREIVAEADFNVASTPAEKEFLTKYKAMFEKLNKANESVREQMDIFDNPKSDIEKQKAGNRLAVLMEQAARTEDKILHLENTKLFKDIMAREINAVRSKADMRLATANREYIDEKVRLAKERYNSKKAELEAVMRDNASFDENGVLKRNVDILRDQMNEMKAEYEQALKQARVQARWDVAGARKDAENAMKQVREKAKLDIADAKASTAKRYETIIANKAERLRMREKQQKYASRISTTANDMINWLASPDVKSGKYVNSALQKPLGEMLNALNIWSRHKAVSGEMTQADIRLDAKLNAMANAIRLQTAQEDNNVMIPPIIADAMSKIAESIDTVTSIEKNGRYINPSLYDLSVNDLEELDTCLRVVKRVLSDVNKSYSRSIKENIDRLGRYMTDYLHGIDSRTTKSGIADSAKWDTCVPWLAFDRLGYAGKSLYSAIIEGTGKKARREKQINDFVFGENGKGGAWTSKESREWSKHTNTFTMEAESMDVDEDGVRNVNERKPITFTLTDAQIMSLYMTMKRAQGAQHLVQGGMRIENTYDMLGRAKAGQVDNQVIKLSLDQYRKIVKGLSERQLEVCKKIDGFLKVSAEWGNEVTEKLYGIRMFTEENYFPLTTDPYSRNMKGETGARGADLLKLANMSFTFALNAKANNAAVIGSVFDRFSSHVSDMANYSTMLMPVMDTVRVLNYKQYDKIENGVDRNGETKYRYEKNSNESVHNQLDRAFGKGVASRYFTRFIQDISNETRTDKRGADAIMGLFQRSKGANVMGNISVVLKQGTSVVRSIIEMPELLNHPQDITRISGFFNKKARDEMLDHSGMALAKSMGSYDMNLGTSLAMKIAKGESIIDKIGEYSMYLAEKADEHTFTALWMAAKREYAKRAGVSMKDLTSEQLDELGHHFDDMVVRTQVIDSVITRSDIMRSTNPVAKMLTSYMAEPTLTYNTIMSAVERAVRDKKMTGHVGKTSAKVLALTGAAWAAGAAMNGILSAFMSAFRDDDDYYSFMEKFLRNLLGKESFLDSTLFDSVNPFALHPTAQAIYNAIVNKESALGTILDGVLGEYDKMSSEAAKLFSGDKNASPAKLMYYSAKLISHMMGIPLYNVGRDSIAAWNTAMDAMDNKDAKIQIFGSRDTTGYERAYEAVLDGDRERFAAARKNLRDNGKTDADIQKNIATKVVADLKIGRIDADTAVRYLDEYCGMSSNDAYWKVKNAIDDYDTNSDYNEFKELVGNMDPVSDAVEELLSHGKTASSVAGQVTKVLKPMFYAADARTRKEILDYAAGVWRELGYTNEQVQTKRKNAEKNWAENTEEDEDKEDEPDMTSDWFD